MRDGTSDWDAFIQVFLDGQYDLSFPNSPAYIVDAGANVGLASLYFLRRFPQARVISIEPDPENFAIAQKNLAPFGDRCHLVNAALWSTAGTLFISRGTFRDGRHWATQTLPLQAAGEETVQARTIKSLTNEFRFPRVDLLKMDIEGAEVSVFGLGDTSFLGNTQVCAVECHGAEGETAFKKAAMPYGFKFKRFGELTVASKVSD